MKANYTEAAKERCFSLIDADIDGIWADIENMPEDTDSKKWKKKLIAIASEYTLSSRFALMRIFQRQAVSAQEIDADSSVGFHVSFSDGSVGEFKDISIEHAGRMEQDELDLYEKLMMDRASRQTEANCRDDLRLIQKALQTHQKKTTLLSKDEALALGHIIGLTLSEMDWFLLRVFNVDGSFRFNSSDDLIDAYVFLRSENHKTGASPEELKEWYRKNYGEAIKTPHDEKLDWTLDNSSSLADDVRKWSADNCDKLFKEWMAARAEHLDCPSATALRVYRNLAVYVFNLIKDDKEEKGNKPEFDYVKTNYPDVDYLAHKDIDGEYKTNFVFAIRNARKSNDISFLFEDGKISRKQCNLVADKLLHKNQALVAVIPHPDFTKNWRDLHATDKGEVKSNGGINATRSRVSDILFGSEYVKKNDMLYLIWFITCLCWGYGSDDPDIRTRLAELIDVCENTLNDAGLPAFYPPHIMEQGMMLSTVHAYGCKRGEIGGEPLLIYNLICELFVEHRETKNKTSGATPSNKISTLRRSLKFNQTQLADKLGVKQTTVSAWERGKIEPSEAQKEQMAGFFHVSVHELMNP